MTSGVEIDVTAPSVRVVLPLLVYWQDTLMHVKHLAVKLNHIWPNLKQQRLSSN